MIHSEIMRNERIIIFGKKTYPEPLVSGPETAQGRIVVCLGNSQHGINHKLTAWEFLREKPKFGSGLGDMRQTSPVFMKCFT